MKSKLKVGGWGIIVMFLLFVNVVGAQVKKSLLINGDNIWVRDQPGTGEVIMKLRNHVLCEVISAYQQFEIINGSPHYWIQIRFNEKYGYVFGSQTNYPFEGKPIVANSPAQLWVEFIDFYQQKGEILEEDIYNVHFNFKKMKIYLNSVTNRKVIRLNINIIKF
jgi:hypothetical protein